MLLSKLRRHREEAGDAPITRYDSSRQTSQVLEAGRWVDAESSLTLQMTKKADVEKGEDQKGS